MQNSKQMDNADKLQSVISDDLFPQVQHISDVKQVIEEMTGKAQELQQDQIKGLLLLKSLGANEYLHGKIDPYKEIYNYISDDGKKAFADPEYYLDTIEALIPKPPRPIVMAPSDMKGGRK